LVKLLVDSKANIHTKTDAGQTPLEMALEKNFTETAILIKSSAGYKP
jgi:ankyrin repeat protein